MAMKNGSLLGKSGWLASMVIHSNQAKTVAEVLYIKVEFLSVAILLLTLELLLHPIHILSVHLTFCFRGTMHINISCHKHRYTYSTPLSVGKSLQRSIEPGYLLSVLQCIHTNRHSAKEKHLSSFKVFQLESKGDLMSFSKHTNIKKTDRSLQSH